MTESINNKVFNFIPEEADATHVDLFGSKSEGITKEDIHNMLMVAGFTPALGNIADAADAALYAFEGEFGSAALSATAMIPFIGQAVSAKRALKLAKESGEEMVTLYRGVDQWYPGKMVKDRKFVGAGAHGSGFVHNDMYSHLNRKTIWTSRVRDYVEQSKYVGQDPGRITLEFEVPKSYVNKFAKETGRGFGGLDDAMETYFEEGLPVEFLKKVHK